MDHDAVRPEWACALHREPRDGADWTPADDHYATCSPCLDRVREVMTDIRRRYLLLDPRPGASIDNGSRGAPGFGSRSPASDHVIAFTDPRSSQTARVWVGGDGRVHREDERPPVSVRATLDTLAWTVAEELRMTGPKPRSDVYELLRHLDRRLDLITRLAGLVVETDTVLRWLRAAMRPVTGDPRGRYIGDCPATVDTMPDLGYRPAYDTDPGVFVSCGARLHAPVVDDTVTCRSCGATWGRERWLTLGHQLQVEHSERWVTSETASTILRDTYGIEVAPATIRTWARRDHVRRSDGPNHRRLVNLGDVRKHAVTRVAVAS